MALNAAYLILIDSHASIYEYMYLMYVIRVSTYASIMILSTDNATFVPTSTTVRNSRAGCCALCCHLSPKEAKVPKAFPSKMMLMPTINYRPQKHEALYSVNGMSCILANMWYSFWR